MAGRKFLGIPIPGMRVREDERPPSDPSTALVIPRRQDVSAGVTVAESFSLSMVYRAVQILVTSTKQLSIAAYRHDERIPDQPMLLRRPDIDQSRSAFLEETVVALACSGNAYWRKYLGDDDRTVIALKSLNPLDVAVEHKGGRVTGYRYGDKVLAPSEVAHLRLLRVPGSVYGLGPIQAAKREIRGALDTRDYASNWFTESGVPNGVLTSEQALTAETAAEAKTRWNESNGAKHGVAVLGQGLKYAPVYLSPSDAQFLETQQFNVTQIARLFGVPASLMLATVEGSTDTYQNVSQDWLGFTRFSLMAYLIEIEDALSDLLPRGQEAKFNVEALLRADTKSRYDAHKVALEAGFMTIDEIRTIENLPKLPTATAPATTPAQEPANA